MELKDYLKIVRRRWISILAVALICAAAAAAFTLTQTKEYASGVSLFVSTTVADTDAGTINAGGQFSQARVQSYVDLASSRELATTVINKLGLDETPEELVGQVSAAATINTVNMTLTVTDPDPHQAQAIAQAYAEALTDLVRTLETPPGETTAPIKATIVDSASYSASPVSPQPIRNIGLGVVIGVLLGLGIAVARQVLDTRVHGVAEVTELTGKPMLGAIAYDSATRESPLIVDLPAHSPRSEAFRVLRTNLQFVDIDEQSKVFVVSSAIPAEGKTTISTNLALSLAQGGARVLLIEGDLRRPRAASRLGLDGAVGLTNVLVGKVKLEDALQGHELAGLTVLAAGPVPPNPAELLQSRAMHELLGTLRDSFDVVLIDAPPLLPVTDAALLSRLADGAILVVKHGAVTKDQVSLSAERLAQVDARLLGFIMNMMPAGSRRDGYGYGYGYGYAPSPSSDDK